MRWGGIAADEFIRLTAVGKRDEHDVTDLSHHGFRTTSLPLVSSDSTCCPHAWQNILALVCYFYRSVHLFMYQGGFTHEEIHVEEEVHVQGTEVQEVCHESPDLPLANQGPAEEKLCRRGCVQLAHGLGSVRKKEVSGGGNGKRSVR